MASQRRWWVGLAVGAGLLIPWLGGGRAMAQQAGAAQAQPTVIELKFVEQKEDASSWYGFMPDQTGKVERAFACKSGKLLMQLTGDKLRVDSNGDGVIDDKDAPAVELKDRTPTTRPTEYVRPIRVKVAVPFAGKMVDYPFSVQSQNIGGGNQRYILVGSAAVLEGRFGDQTIRIFDGNQDGKFGNQGDRIGYEPADRNDPYARFGTPWSKVVSLASQLYNIELMDDGAKLKLTAYTGPVAEVRVEGDPAARNLFVMLQGAEEGQIGQLTSTKSTKFVPGKYRIYSMQAQIGPTSRPSFLTASHDPQKPAPIELKAGENVLKVGPPLKMGYEANYDNGTLYINNVSVAGVAGELYRPYVQPNTSESFAYYIKAGGKEKQLASLQFG